MYESFRAGYPVSMDVHSVAAGLSPPMAGKQLLCGQYIALRHWRNNREAPNSQAVSLVCRFVTSSWAFSLCCSPVPGANTYRHCRQFVQDVLLVSDAEILNASFTLYNRGLVVEPSGSCNSLAFNVLQCGLRVFTVVPW